MHTARMLAALALIVACASPTAPDAAEADRVEAHAKLSSSTAFTASCAGLTCTFTPASGGNVSFRRWDFGDGTPLYDPEAGGPWLSPGKRALVVTHTYAPGTYTVTLYVTYRSDLRVEQASQTVTLP